MWLSPIVPTLRPLARSTIMNLVPVAARPDLGQPPEVLVDVVAAR